MEKLLVSVLVLEGRLPVWTSFTHEAGGSHVLALCDAFDEKKKPILIFRALFKS